MRSPLETLLALSIFLSGIASAAAAQVERAPGGAIPDEAARWLPASCIEALRVAEASAGDEDRGETAEARWNRVYRLGVEAIGIEDLEAAEVFFCQALQAARTFEPRDVRFAETLDELGLVAYLAGDDASAEAVQGAAVAEMLLALGPPGENLTQQAEKSCKSSVATYLVRLGWIYERQERGGEIELLLEEPYRILARGYVPYRSLAGRLDWLTARYLLIEDFAAADWLSALRDSSR